MNGTIRFNFGILKGNPVCVFAGIVCFLVISWLLLGPKFDGEKGTFVEPVFQRKFTRLQTQSSSDREFCVVSYNILRDPHMNTTGKAYLPLSSKENSKRIGGKNSARHKQMMKELKWLSADFLNLQEVEEFYFPILVDELGALGYSGVFDQHREDTNGVATFYRKNKFKMIKTETYNFKDLLDEICDKSELRINKSHGAQRIIKFTLLEDVYSQKELLIANTHILFGSWHFPDMQALQIALFLQTQKAFLLRTKAGQATPWVLTGDFNMYPHFPVYEMIATGHMSEEGLDKINPYKYTHPQVVKKAEVKEGESLVLKYCKHKLSHPLQGLKSAYKTILGSEPPLSHYQINENFPELYGFTVMKGTLDYIFYSSNSLEVNAILEPVKEEVIKPLVACPNKYFPSDHLSIKACFSLNL